uniref:Uncharacterized protein n=1 Tax=Picea glauca TaxID=3330 RepID=A0A101M0G3_PICGL|nr:hypothetical protein ABT39_MTgene4745 [Picea glauca]
MYSTYFLFLYILRGISFMYSIFESSLSRILRGISLENVTRM